MASPLQLLFLVLILALHGCTNLSQQSVPLDLNVSVDDPTLQKIASVTEDLRINASGVFQAGKYKLNNIPITIDHDTTFELALTVPVKGSTVIGTGGIDGVLTTSEAIKVAGIPCPLSVTVSRGQATAAVDLIRTIGAFLIQVLDSEEASEKYETTVGSMFHTVTVKDATFYLREGSSIDLTNLGGTFGPSSRIVFSDLQFDKSFDYRGTISVLLNMKKAWLSYPEKKSSCQSNNTNIALTCKVVTQGDRMNLSMKNIKDVTTLQLKDYALKTEKASLQGKDCQIKIDNFQADKILGTNKASVFSSGVMETQGSEFVFQGKVLGLVAQLPDANEFKWLFEHSNKAKTLTFNSERTNTDGLVMTLHQGDQQVAMDFRRADLGSLMVSREEGVTLALQDSILEPNTMRWHSKGRDVLFTISPGARVTLPGDALIYKEAGKFIETEGLIADIDAGSIKIQTKDHNFSCEDVRGNLVIDADSENIDLKGKLAFKALSQKELVGVTDIAAQVKEVELKNEGGHLFMNLKGCRIVVPPEDVEKAVAGSLPEKKTFPMDKAVFADRKWRYRNLKVKEFTIIRPTIKRLRFGKEENTVKLSGGSDVAADGTVERFALNILNDQEKGWSTHPWSATGHIDGDGMVSYKLLPGKSLNDAQIQYKADITLETPEGLKVDWSKVAGDMLGRAEQALIGSVVRRSGYFDDDGGIRISQAGTVPLIKKRDPRLSLIRLTQFSTRNTPFGVTVDFSARAQLN